VVDSLNENELCLDNFFVSWNDFAICQSVYMNNHCSAEGVKARIFAEQRGVS